MNSEHQQMCHHVRNGILVIKALCYQARRGTMTVEEAFSKIEQRCNELDKALAASPSSGPKPRFTPETQGAQR